MCMAITTTTTDGELTAVAQLAPVEEAKARVVLAPLEVAGSKDDTLEIVLKDDNDKNVMGPKSQRCQQGRRSLEQKAHIYKEILEHGSS